MNLNPVKLHLCLPFLVTSFHILEQVTDACECLFAAGQDLIRRQDETIVASVPELRSKCIVALDDVGDIVDAAATGLVNCCANRAIIEAGSVNRVDGGDGTLGQGLILVVVGRQGTAGVAICYDDLLDCLPLITDSVLTRHEKLRIRVVINVQLKTLRIFNALEEAGQGFRLRSIAGAAATEVIGARVRRRTGATPFVRPVTVDIMAKAAAAGCGLAILAPHPVCRLGVFETYFYLAYVDEDKQARGLTYRLH